MPDVCHQLRVDGAAPGQAVQQTEALLAGVLAAAKAALPEGLDLLVWGAARVGDHATLRHLLSIGGGSSWTPSKDDERWGRDSPLRVASRFGHGEAVKELLESGVDVDEVRADTGVTPLYLAAQEGHQGVVKQLLKAGADFNKATTHDGVTPLYMAAQNGHESVVEQLLKAGADVEKATTAEGATPLWIAACREREGMVDQLLEAGADVNKTGSGVTPLYMAAQNGHEGMVEKLLKAGADVNKAATDDGTTPLYMAAEIDEEGIVEKLLKAGADPNTANPLVCASYCGHSRICSLLLEYGANVNLSHSDDGSTALEVAVHEGHQEVALLLIEHGATSSGETMTPPMLKDLNKWMAEALQENKRVIADTKRQMKAMVQGIPEWCAQAASAVLADEGNNGGNSSGGSAPVQVQPGDVGRKRKAPPSAE